MSDYMHTSVAVLDCRDFVRSAIRHSHPFTAATSVAMSASQQAYRSGPGRSWAKNRSRSKDFSTEMVR